MIGIKAVRFGDPYIYCTGEVIYHICDFYGFYQVIKFYYGYNTVDCTTDKKVSTKQNFGYQGCLTTRFVAQ